MSEGAEGAGTDSVIRDPGLAPGGLLKIEWVKSHMPVLAAITAELLGFCAGPGSASGRQPLAGLRVAACLHLEAKTANLLLSLRDLGADVVACGSNPLSTQDDVVAALIGEPGIRVYAWHGATPDEYHRFVGMAAATGPDIVIDDGADLITTLHADYPDLAARVRGGAEETTTGVIRLTAMAGDGALRFPVLAVNDTPMKRIFDNKYGTGQSCWDGIMRCTNLSVAGKTVVVAGYGFCGRGVAMRAVGLGARVIVVEVDPVAANEALMDGHAVMPMSAAAEAGDVFVTTTGCCDAVRGEHLARIRDGALLANAGHFNVEINLAHLAALCKGPPRRVRANVDEYRTRAGRRLYLLGEGRLVNLAAADGHPTEVMDLSFALQALAVLHIATGQLDGLGGRVVRMPAALDRKVAELRLASLGVELERLTPAQQDYLRAWQV
ncbi:MAG: adenosylhomocysteinase [Bacillota bacterium]|nr:adenosylhomocysteinase [Bacillota bacterium]